MIQTVVSCLFIYFIKFLKNVDQVETQKRQQSQFRKTRLIIVLSKVIQAFQDLFNFWVDTHDLKFLGFFLKFLNMCLKS